jgi:hypothetical protein
VLPHLITSLRAQRLLLFSQVQVEIQKLRKLNPFAAISSKREAAPQSLFGLQIHRSDLTPVKVIGYGQFGEVAATPTTIQTHSHTCARARTSDVCVCVCARARVCVCVCVRVCVCVCVLFLRVLAFY